MAFMRYADASVVQPHVSQRGWTKVRKTASQPSRNLVSQASEILGEPFNPDRYLLTHCFPAGHMVLMADGTEKPIEDIEVGDLVITHKGNVKPVTTLLRKEVDEELTVIKAASVPEVVCTGEHPFYIIREANAWCSVYPSYQGQVKCTFGGKQVCEKNSCLTNGAVPDWVDARDVRVGDRTYTPTLHRTQVSDDLNPNRMRLLGYYVAEGRVDNDHDGRLHSIRFSIHEDEIPTLGSEIARLMRMEFGVPTHSIIRDKQRDTKGVTLSFHSHEYAPWFLRHAGCGSRIQRLSPEVVWSPVDWQRQLIGAWINGDGCYDGLRDSGNNGIHLSTSSDDLASQAVVILDRMGVHSRLQKVDTKGREYKGRWIKGTDGWHVEVSASYLPKLADVVHWAVVGTAHKWLSTKGRYRYAASTLSTVEAVERRHFKGTVYNMSVQDDESYIVNRQAVHNCTIVASVDVEAVPNVKLGRVKVSKHGKTINRKYADYYIRPQCSQFVNNNGDSWSREVLLASYRTFIGGHNFLEHVQIEEQSKGRIIDAVARDIGDSVYIDILVATDRRHTQLVADIEAGEMGTLSMGCSVEECICTKCGNCAVDETELCDHIKYAKRNKFHDEQGQQRIVAELCGHPSLPNNGGVHFIEASWVAVPAFTGAVMRNILEPTALPAEMARRVQAVLDTPPPQWTHNVDPQKVRAASMPSTADLYREQEAEVVGTFTLKSQWDVGDEGGADSAEDQKAEPEKSKLDDASDELYNDLVEKAVQRVQDDLRKKDTENALAPEDSTAWQNDTLNKEARSTRYQKTVFNLAKTASSDADFLNRLASLDQSFGLKLPMDLYRGCLKVGAFSDYRSTSRFFLACREALERPITPAELRVMLRVGKLLSRLGSITPAH